ncbi:MAG: hypothetical protein ACRC2R_23105 [Xenococcaceae cyanobacterium]
MSKHQISFDDAVNEALRFLIKIMQENREYIFRILDTGSSAKIKDKRLTKNLS